MGAPILKNKLFFFANYQGSRFNQPANSVPYTVFTAAERQGNFGSICSAGFNTQGICNNLSQQLYNPFSASTPGGRNPFLNNPTNIPFSPPPPTIPNSPLYPRPTTNPPP